MAIHEIELESATESILSILPYLHLDVVISQIKDKAIKLDELLSLF